MPDNDDEIKVPEKSFNSIDGRAEWHREALRSMIALNNKFTATNESLEGLGTKLLEAAKILKKSSEDIAKSNNKYSRSLAWFTGALVFVGLLHVLVVIYPDLMNFFLNR